MAIDALSLAAAAVANLEINDFARVLGKAEGRSQPLSGAGCKEIHVGGVPAAGDGDLVAYCLIHWRGH